MKIKKTDVVLLVLIVALGFFVRFVNINHTPPGVYPDEAVNGMDAINAMHGQWQWFYTANNGREGMFMNLIAICFKIFGISILGLKLPGIIFGTLTVLGVFFLARELFKSTRLGLIASFLVATAFWDINFSRIAFRAVSMPAVMAWAFYYLMLSIRTKKFSHAAIAGAIFGLGLHTYIAYRIAPLILVVMLVTFLFTRKNFIKDYWKQLLVYILFAIIVASPMIYFFYQHPEYFSSRTSEISVMSPEVNHGHLAAALFKTVSLSLIKYNIWGDQNWRQNFPPYPILDPLTGLLFTIGLIYAIVRLIRLLVLRFSKKENDPQLETYMLLLSWFFIMLIPEFMAYEGNPHALRSIGTMPPVFIFSALSIEYLFLRAEKYTYLMKRLTVGFLCFMLLFIGAFNVIKYHFFWANQPQTAQAFDHDLMEINSFIKTQPTSEEIFVVEESMQRIPVELFNWGRPNTYYVYPGQTDQINPKDLHNFIVILSDPSDSNVAANLEQKFPRLGMTQVSDNSGMGYYVLKLK